MRKLKCSKCKKMKPEDDFSPKKFISRGRHYACMSCRREEQSTSNKRHQTERAAYNKRRNKTNKTQQQAYSFVRNALKTDRMTKMPCKVCGNAKASAHHESYAREDWGNVVWLCVRHHKARHCDIERKIPLQDTLNRLWEEEGRKQMETPRE